MRARQERLREMAANFSGGATIDSGAKFSFISLGPRRKERSRHSAEAHLRNAGAVTWRVLMQEAHLPNVASTLAISNELLLLIAEESRAVIFSCSCRDVIGWSSGAASVKIFHEHGDCIALSALEQYEGDVREIVHRLEIVSRGCETVEMTLLRNAIGQLGFHVNFEGVVADVEPHGHAWKAGLRQGSRLVEICSIAVPVLTHEKMIDLLRTSPTVTVLTVQPHEDGTPRRGCSELCRVPLVEYKVDSRGTPCEYKTPFRRNTTWQPVPSLMSETPTLPLSSPTHIRNKTGDPTLPENSSGVLDMEGTLQYRESPGNQSSSSNSGTKFEMQPVETRGNQGDRDPLREAVLEKARSTEAKYHIPTAKVLNSLKNEGGRESPSRLSRVGERSCLSRCSSNTLSSTASSSSEGKRFGSGDLMDPEVLSLACIRGASTDSGIDTASCVLAPPSGGVAGVRAGLQWEELPEDSGLEEEESAKLYLPSGRAPFVRAPPLAGGSTGDLSEISSQSSGSHYSGSPGVRGRRVAGSRVSARPCPRLPPPNDQLIGWKKAADRPHLDEQSDQTECGKLYAAEASYRLWAEGQGEEHLLMLTDHQTSLPGSLSPRRSLCRTQSEESVCGNRKGSAHSSALDHALPNDILFSSTPPHPCTPSPGTPANESWSSVGPPVDRTKFCDQTVMPLPDTGSGLDWSQLVDAARAFEDQQMAPLCTLTDMQRAEALQISQELRRRAESAGSADLETGPCSPALLTDKVNQLEVILRQLQLDLQKEKQHKAVLQEEVQHLRQDNMRLQEASQSSAAQLRKFSGWFYHSPNERQ
ncbi:hypothetical protein GJAV_G00241480 [Gymnothorax javanicus]|nr:hypothetical protein GJAV_G00241480 [Gymnothorax javanicus]